MRGLLLALPLLAAGCATASTPYAPVRVSAYQAMGANPTWVLAIGDDRMVLRTSDGNGHALGPYIFPRVLPRTVADVRTWQTDQDTNLHITIEARRSPCSNQGGQAFEDQVHVRWSTVVFREHASPEDVTQELDGCGGRLLNRKHDG